MYWRQFGNRNANVWRHRRPLARVRHLFARRMSQRGPRVRRWRLRPYARPLRGLSRRVEMLTYHKSEA